jgi:hypothetical protein
MRPDELSLEEQLIASKAIADYRRNQTMEKVQWEVNIAQTVALKYADGKRVESRYNEYETMFSLIDGRVLYASPALSEKIAALEPAAGEEFTICKREIRDGQRKRIEWQVGPVAEDRSQEPEDRRPAPPAPVGPRPVPAKAPAPVAAPANSMTEIMTSSLIAAIDALDAAAQYAERKGTILACGADETIRVANSIFIQFWKDRETRARYPQTTPERVNGGTAWQQ